MTGFPTSRHPQLACHGMGTSHPLGSESSDTLLVVDWYRAKKCTQILRIDADLSIRRGALNQWPIIPRRAGLHLVVRDGRKQSTFRLIMYQARCLKLPRGTMGCSLKLMQSTLLLRAITWILGGLRRSAKLLSDGCRGRPFFPSVRKGGSPGWTIRGREWRSLRRPASLDRRRAASLCIDHCRRAF